VSLTFRDVPWVFCRGAQTSSPPNGQRPPMDLDRTCCWNAAWATRSRIRRRDSSSAYDVSLGRLARRRYGRSCFARRTRKGRACGAPTPHIRRQLRQLRPTAIRAGPLAHAWLELWSGNPTSVSTRPLWPCCHIAVSTVPRQPKSGAIAGNVPNGRKRTAPTWGCDCRKRGRMRGAPGASMWRQRTDTRRTGAPTFPSSVAPGAARVVPNR